MSIVVPRTSQGITGVPGLQLQVHRHIMHFASVLSSGDPAPARGSGLARIAGDPIIVRGLCVATGLRPPDTTRSLQ